jgi:hypothetical protein
MLGRISFFGSEFFSLSYFGGAGEIEIELDPGHFCLAAYNVVVNGAVAARAFVDGPAKYRVSVDGAVVANVTCEH